MSFVIRTIGFALCSCYLLSRRVCRLIRISFFFYYWLAFFFFQPNALLWLLWNLSFSDLKNLRGKLVFNILKRGDKKKICWNISMSLWLIFWAKKWSFFCFIEKFFSKTFASVIRSLFAPSICFPKSFVLQKIYVHFLNLKIDVFYLYFQASYWLLSKRNW